jgi:hypothetical protein
MEPSLMAALPLCGYDCAPLFHIPAADPGVGLLALRGIPNAPVIGKTKIVIGADIRLAGYFLH